MTHEIQEQMILEKMNSTNRAKKRINPNLTATSTISPASIMSPKKGTFSARAGSH